VQRGFPRGLFFELQETQLGASGALATFDAGVVVSEAALVADATVVKQLDFEDSLLTPEQPFSRLKVSTFRHDALFAPVVTAGAAARRRDAVESAARAPRFTMREMVSG
jgi:hypothetical protein